LSQAIIQALPRTAFLGVIDDVHVCRLSL
jgi:hypothetical protein